MRTLSLFIIISFSLFGCGKSKMEEDGKKLAELEWKVTQLTQKIVDGDDSVLPELNRVKIESEIFMAELEKRYSNEESKLKLGKIYLEESEKLKTKIYSGESPEKTNNENQPNTNEFVVNIQEDIFGMPGQVTFYNQEGQVLFFFNSSNKSGKIKINNNEYLLKKLFYDYNNVSYYLTGDDVSIETSKGIIDDNEGGDCINGRFGSIIINLNSNKINIDNVESQNCPNYEDNESSFQENEETLTDNKSKETENYGFKLT